MDGEDVKKVRNLFRGNFAKSVVMISGSTVVAQALNFLLSTIITRIYTPEQYGVLTVYSSILGLIVIVASLNYEWGIPIADNDRKAMNVLQLSFAILLVFSAGVLVFFSVFGKRVLSSLNAKGLVNYIYLIPIGVFLSGSYNILLQWAYRKKDFRAISKTKIAQSIVGNGTKIGLGVAGTGSVGLIIGQILSQCAGIYTFMRTLVDNEENRHIGFDWDGIITAAKRYRNFPIFSAPSSLLNTLGLQLPVLFITSFYGGKVLGFYGLANSVVNLPMVLIGTSIADVLYAEAAGGGKNDPRKVNELMNKLVKRLLIVGLIPLSVLLLFGPFLFALVFGKNWYEAGVYARIIAFLVFFRFLFTPFDRLFAVFERQKISLFLDSLRVVLVVTAFGIAKLLDLSSYLAIALYSLAMCIVYCTTYVLVKRMLRQEIRRKENEALHFD
mgnify:FL=1